MRVPPATNAYVPFRTGAPGPCMQVYAALAVIGVYLPKGAGFLQFFMDWSVRAPRPSAYRLA